MLGHDMGPNTDILGTLGPKVDDNPTNRKAKLSGYEGKLFGYALKVQPLLVGGFNPVARILLVKLDHFPR